MKELIAIQTKLKVAKTRKNDFANFTYRSLEDITEALKPYLDEQQCYLTFNDSLIQMGNRFYIQSTVTLFNKEGQSISATALAREPDEPKKKMDESQTTGSTSSYARKYAANGLFCLDDDNTDPDSQINKEKPIEEQLSDMRIELFNLLNSTNKWKVQILERYGLITIDQMTESQVIEAYRGFEAKGYFKKQQL